jgi:hypothetical protein
VYASPCLSRSGLSLITWHCRFGHLHNAAIQNLARSRAVTGLELDPPDTSKCSDLVCDGCVAGKAHRAPFAGPVSSSHVPLSCVFSNLLTLSSPPLPGCRYTIVFVDNHTRMLWTKPHAAKSDALQATQEWIASFQKSSGCEVQCLHTDNGGKYTSRAYSDYLALHHHNAALPSVELRG